VYHVHFTGVRHAVDGLTGHAHREIIVAVAVEIARSQCSAEEGSHVRVAIETVAMEEFTSVSSQPVG